MDQDPALNPRKQPKQGRSRATFQAILEACTQLLHRGGVAAVTTNALAERAGVSIGSLYQYFPSKEAVLAELVRGLREEMFNDIAAILNAPEAAGLSKRDLVYQVVRASLRHHDRSPELAQVLEMVEEALPMSEEVAAGKARVGALLIGLLRDIGVAKPEEAARDLVALSGGMAAAAVQAGETDFDALAHRIHRAVIGYLEL